MSGQGVRFQQAGYQLPKPLISISGRPMISRVLESFPNKWPTHFVIADNHLPSDLPGTLKQLRPEAELHSIPVHREGPIKAIEKGLEGIPDHEAVFVSYCDYGMEWDHREFEDFVHETNCDAVIISYRGFHPHYLGKTQYAYSKVINGRVKEVKEKGSFTAKREEEFASSGGYYFKSAKLLKEALKYQREKRLVCNDEYYTSLSVQALIESRPESDVRVFEISKFFQWGTPEDIQDFEYWEKTFKNFERFQTLHLENVAQILMPMAGKGSRFNKYLEAPKPFIRFNQIPMYLHALNSLPRAATTVLVGLKSFKEYFNTYSYTGAQLELLEQTPEGQALTTLAGASYLDPLSSVLVSSCDHSIVLDPGKWKTFLQSPLPDAVIFTIKNFPGVRSAPMAYAYVKTDNSGIVQLVSVKQPLSENPLKDDLLVGTFWFKEAQLLSTWIKKLQDRDVRVNGELYLDSVFQMMLEQGLKVKIIPLDGYINWGDPASLSAALYWQEVFTDKKISDRPVFSGLGNI